MNISINCPSYKRPKVKTLEYLPFCKVWVDNKEYNDYIEANKEFEENIISCPDGVQGNLCRIRNYILDKEFENGADVVLIIDDDMSGIYHFEGNREYCYNKILVEPNEFYDFIEKYSVMCDELGFKFWGLNCNQDALSYRQYSPFSTVSYVGGPFQCFLKNDLRYDERLPLKEDYDMTLQQCNKYRGCLRLNKFFYSCKQSKQAGGCATYRNYDREIEQLELLQRKWGKNIVKIDSVKNSNQKKESKKFDYNPIIKIPIKGI